MNTKPQKRKLSIDVDESIAKAIEETAKDENIGFSDQARRLLNTGLQDYGYSVRGNQVINNTPPTG